MDEKMRVFRSANPQINEEEMGVRKGPWMAEEDSVLFNYISSHGEGRWNSVALSTGLKRTGKSCRLRWLNYLRPRVRRGNITLQEQLLILELQFCWGNRWSKIAQYLPGRTDNEIKNYWRTRVQKLAKELNYDVNSKQFRDAMRYVWMPRLFERIQASSGESESKSAADHPQPPLAATGPPSQQTPGFGWVNPQIVPATTSESFSDHDQFSTVSEVNEFFNRVGPGEDLELYELVMEQSCDVNMMNGWVGGGEPFESLWDEEDIWFMQQYFENNI